MPASISIDSRCKVEREAAHLPSAAAGIAQARAEAVALRYANCFALPPKVALP